MRKRTLSGRSITWPLRQTGLDVGCAVWWLLGGHHWAGASKWNRTTRRTRSTGEDRQAPHEVAASLEDGLRRTSAATPGDCRSGGRLSAERDRPGVFREAFRAGDPTED